MEKLAVTSLEECLEDLQDEIVFGHNSDTFRVYPIETAGGKTYTTIKAMSDSYKFEDNQEPKRYIFVTKLRKEGLKVATDINERVGENIAMFYTTDKKMKSENCSNNFYECVNTSVLVITHSMYCKISNPITAKQEEYRSICQKYKTLVIDEEINPVKDSFFEFNTKCSSWETILKSFSRYDLASKFKSYINPLMLLLEKDYKNNSQLHRIELDYNRKEINLLYDELQEGAMEIFPERFTDYAEENEDYSCTRENLLELLDNIFMTYDCIDNNVALVQPKSGIYSYNYNFKYLMLDNNIWLDASASFNTMYKSDMFNVIKCAREIDHAKCEFRYHNTNTSTSSKNNDENFRKNISDYIKENHKDKKTLILSKKTEIKSLQKEEKYLKECGYDYLNFEEMRGVDDYKDHEVCYYIHTYRWTPAYYIFCYEYFKDINLTDDELIVSNSKFILKKKRWKIEWGFNKEELYDLMITDMASSMYQGLKRVQRSRNPQAIFEVFTSNTTVLMIVLDQLKGMEDNFINVDKGKQTDADRILEFIDNRIKEADGNWKRIKSKEVMDELNINSNNWNKIWNNEIFNANVNERKIGQSKAKAGGKQGARLVNWLTKHK